MTANKRKKFINSRYNDCLSHKSEENSLLAQRIPDSTCMSKEVVDGNRNQKSSKL